MPVARAAVIAAACLAAVACWEEPVREHLHLTVLGDRAFVIAAIQDVAGPAVAESNPRLAARLDEARAAIERGSDRWRPLFDELQPAIERTTIDKEDGVARRAICAAATADFEPVARLLAAQGLDATLQHRSLDDDHLEHELRVWPIGSPPATSNERAEVERRLDEWSVTIAEYLTEAAAFYRYLDRRPDRAVPCLSHLFDRHGPDPQPLEPEEDELVGRLKGRIQAVAEALKVAAGDAHTLNELSRLAYDPFPARLTVAVRGELVEVEGLIEGDGFVERPSVDLWRALAALEGRWLSPDLVTAMIAPGPQELQPDPDPQAFAAIGRRWAEPPAPPAVAAALRAGLVPAELHRVLWRSTAAEAAGLDEDPWRLLDGALADLPP
ncbi:MAG TPA: hypothetical protein PLS95_02445 [Thermoanaerobaculales bacterium]|nr:hypothetical protein [Thermoanaerobaculales bacterium]